MVKTVFWAVITVAWVITAYTLAHQIAIRGANPHYLPGAWAHSGLNPDTNPQTGTTVLTANVVRVKGGYIWFRGDSATRPGKWLYKAVVAPNTAPPKRLGKQDLLIENQDRNAVLVTAWD